MFTMSSVHVQNNDPHLVRPVPLSTHDGLITIAGV